jgi:transposase
MQPAPSLEAENVALRRTLALRDAAIAERDAALAERDTRLTTARLEIEHLRLQLAALRRAQYGQSSERLAAAADQLEMRLEILEEDAAEQQVRGHRPNQPRPRSPSVRKPLPAHLPREVIIHEPERLCSCCPREKLARLGEDVTEVLEKIPARLRVIRHVRPKYACRVCERVFQAPAPDLPIERGRPGPGLLAHVAVSKYCDGLPLYRQSAILEREGVAVDRATMAEWIGHIAWWCRPLAELIGTQVMAQPVLWTDDTPIRTLAPGTGKTRQSRFWCYAVDPRPYAGQGPPAVFYRYSPDRKGERPRDHLSRFTGLLHADAFAGYQALYRADGSKPPRIVHVACWAHARRKLFEVFETTKSPIAEQGLRRIRELYIVEDQINGLTETQRHAARQERSKPLLDSLKTWYDRQRHRVSSKSALGKALRYALSRWSALARFIDDGRLSIDNNLSERLLRGIAISRKNFLFLGSDCGGERAAILFTLIESAKLNGLDPEAYLAQVLDRMARGHSATRLVDLLPWNLQRSSAAAI